MANGDTKTEAMLNVLGNGGTGDEFRGCCNTKTQQYILDAIDRINNIQPGGNYEAGAGIEIADNTISVDTDMIQEKLTAGTNITIDADNVISALGGGGDSIHELTTDDYNWNLTLNSATEPYDCVALWLMPAGWYSKSEGSTVAVVKHANPYGIETFPVGTYFVGVTEGTGANARRPYLYSTYSDKTHWYQSDIDPSTGREYDNAKMLTAADLTIVQTTGASTSDVMSQKAVTDALASAGGGVKVLSTADYNYPSNNPTSLAIWLLDEGQYITSGTLKISFTNSEDITTSDIWGFEVLKKSISAAQRGCYIASDGNNKYIYSAIDTNGANATKSNLTTTIAQSTGTSTTSVMSQNAVTRALANVGGFHVLSAADINWEDADGGGTNNAIALWLLPSGNYYLPTTETMNTPVYAMATEEGSGEDGISITDYRNYDILIAVNGDASYINIRGTDQYETFIGDESSILKSIFVDKRTGVGAILFW